MNSGIYHIVNRQNSNLYVGSAIDIKRRRATHIHRLRRGDHPNPHLQSAWDKYGEQSFDFRPIVFAPMDDLLATEQYHIDMAISNGIHLYNIRPDATSNLGFRHSMESRHKMSINRTGEKNHLFGKKRAPEVIAKMKVALKGRKGPQTGIPLTSLQKAKISMAHKGRKTGPRSEEIKRKISLTRMGTPAWNKGMTRIILVGMGNKRTEDRVARKVEGKTLP